MPGRPIVDALPFTDTTMRVLRVYKGSAGDHIIVSQTGGKLVATETHPGLDMVLQDDPLYVEGGEHILFLVSLGEVEGKQMYATINPAGRYDIRDANVSSPAELFGRYAQPTTLGDLKAAISQAVTR